MSSRADSECRIRNPWGEADVSVYRNGKGGETARGSLLRLAIKQGETVVLAPAGVSLDALKAAV